LLPALHRASGRLEFFPENYSPAREIIRELNYTPAFSSFHPGESRWGQKRPDLPVPGHSWTQNRLALKLFLKHLSILLDFHVFACPAAPIQSAAAARRSAGPYCQTWGLSPNVRIASASAAATIGSSPLSIRFNRSNHTFLQTRTLLCQNTSVLWVPQSISHLHPMPPTIPFREDRCIPADLTDRLHTVAPPRGKTGAFSLESLPGRARGQLQCGPAPG
jgi:hypothetical protein